MHALYPQRDQLKVLPEGYKLGGISNNHIFEHFGAGYVFFPLSMTTREERVTSYARESSFWQRFAAEAVVGLRLTLPGVRCSPTTRISLPYRCL